MARPKNIEFVPSLNRLVSYKGLISFEVSYLVQTLSRHFVSTFAKSP